uniref:Uncharacterized protein n=1 Tax=Leuconostoc citreum TaxID=33964 RepID=A0A098DLN8_LEUCI|nr:Protein of unknown function [Leuconostoc citreum]
MYLASRKQNYPLWVYKSNHRQVHLFILS